MLHQTGTAEELLAAARCDPSQLGNLLQHYRALLVFKAAQGLDRRMVRRVCEADLVQEALAEAAARFGDFRGDTEAEFSAWIQTILAHVLEDAVRVHVLAEKRSVIRERPLYVPDGSASFYWFDFAASDLAPSKRLVQGERALRLAQLVESLPGKQSTVIRLRFLEGLKVREIAETMGLTSTATAGLLKRGLRTLRGRMNEESWFSGLTQSQR